MMKVSIDKLPKRQSYTFGLAYEKASDSDMYQKLGAVFSYNGRPVATGCNNGHRQRYNKQVVCSGHAELSVLWQVVPGTHQIKWYEKGGFKGPEED
jgi:hypothetical protein